MTNVILHCSDSAWGNAAEITRWHLERKFTTIGYHYVILNGKLSSTKQHNYFDGHIETGRALDDDKDMELDEIGAHAFGYNRAVGICLIGKSGEFTKAQIGSLQFLVRKLREQFGEIKVLQHSDVEPKKPFCAGFNNAEMNLFNH